ncbi:MAG TPA: class II fumarate hydratase [Actinomycetota bacterium]|nr:class II fumarate hydratase [Actinomycetota bacterium]
MEDKRIESDSMGLVEVSSGALYGAQTQRAVDNFTISEWRFGRRFLQALGLVKWAAAAANSGLGLLDSGIAAAIQAAAEEVVRGDHDAHFPVDVFQTGSGTSTNMNANEVIANLANRSLGFELGSKKPVHPNDHVNLCQSSNDVIPTATHLAALIAIDEALLPALTRLRKALAAKADAFDHIVKSGRTHLMDATPVRLGQEFGGYAAQVEHAIARIDLARGDLCELALGGTAVGTGVNAHPEFAHRAITHLAERLGLELREAYNHFEAQSARDAVVAASGALKAAAVAMARIANDLRWLASGPASGLGEIRLPDLQPGSSIMPGKVNPVIPEAVIQVSAQVIGNDAAITLGGLGGIFELNTMMPLMAHDLLFNIETLGAAAGLLASKCVEGIEADEKRCSELLFGSLVLVTALVPYLGYDAAARVSKQAYETGNTLKQTVLDLGLMTEDQLDQALDVRSMTEGGLESERGGAKGTLQ